MSDNIHPPTDASAGGGVGSIASPRSIATEAADPHDWSSRLIAGKKHIEEFCDVLSAAEFLIFRIAMIGSAGGLLAFYIWGR